MIKSHGSSNPAAFFIADGPHGKDLDTGYALTGSGEFTIRQFCAEQGFNIEDFWRSCLIKEELPTGDEDTIKLVERYSPILVDEINDLKPFLLIPLGELSFHFLTNLNNIRKFRGSVLPTNGNFQLAEPHTKVLPILGPYPFLQKEYQLRFVSRIDFGKIRKYLNRDPIPDDKHNLWVAKDSESLRVFFERSYEKADFVDFDIETWFQVPICISFCFDGYESVCVPLMDSSIDRANKLLMWDLVDRILRSPLPKVNQNIKYDQKILERWGFKVNNIVGDTMLASSVLYCEFPKNLGFLTSIYTELPYFKDEGKEIDLDKGKKNRYYLYNAKDSLAAHQIYTKQKEEIKELNVQYVYDSLINIMPIYRRMEDTGIRIDEQQAQELLAKYTVLFNIQVEKCKQLLNRGYFNPLSHKQCVEVIFDELGFKPVRNMKRTKTGEPKTDEENLELLQVYGHAEHASQIGNLVLQSILGARKAHKVIEILELPLYPDGRFRCEFNLAGTETGRSSAGETTDQIIGLKDNGKLEIINLGHSLQTIGKHGFMIDGKTYGQDLRSMFVPSYGYKFVECDLQGAEARVDRILSGNFDLAVFDDPGIHKLTGSWIYSCRPDEIKKGVLIDGIDRYHMSKTVRHAGERNMKAGRLAMMTQRPMRECENILAVFHKFQPEIRGVFHSEVHKAIYADTHNLTAPNGRRRDFFGRIDQSAVNEGISFLPQAIVSDQTKFHGIGRTFCDKSIYSWARLLVEAHDGILAEVKIGRELEFAELYKNNIEGEAIDFRTCTLKRDYRLKIPCEVAVGENWYQMKEVELAAQKEELAR